MKEENNATTAPSESQMNDMYKNAWLNFHADAQEAKHDLSRRYAKMVNNFGSYKNMPDGIKEILKQDYAAHEAKWRENGKEMQKRFGVKETEPDTKTTEDQQKKKQEFMQQLQQKRQPRLGIEPEY